MIDKKDIIFKFKKSYTISHNKNYFCCVGGSVNLYDVKKGELEMTFKDMKHPSSSKFTSDNSLIVNTTTGYYFIYDIASKTLINKYRPPKGVLGSTTDFAVTPDNKFIIDFAYIFPYSQLMIMELETGKYMLYDLNRARTGKLLFDESESKYYIITKKNEIVDNQETHYTDFYSFSYPFQTLELQKLLLPKFKHFSDIDYNSGRFAMDVYPNKINIYNINTDEEEQICYEEDGVLYDLKWSENGRYIALAETRKIHIIDVATKRCIKSYDVDWGCFADFYDNDTKLLIGTWEKGYCVDLKSIL